MGAYSSTSLVNKLGIKPGFIVSVFNEPDNYWDLVSPLPAGVKIKSTGKDFDFVHWFVKENRLFEKEFNKKKSLLKMNGMLWMSWPKKASKVATDLNENIIRNFALKNGLVDVKVCSVDDTWSGLKLVYRLTDR